VNTARQPIIELSDIRFRWLDGDPWVLDIPALSIAAGEKVLVTGPSGIGKTTLLNLLGGVVQPVSGKISVMGQQLATLSGARRDTFRANHIGFLFQMFNLVPYLQLIENITLPCRFSALRHQRAVDRSGSVEADAARLAGHMGLDVGALAARPVSLLSVGQQQRIAAARALIGAPELVICDEPTSALDSEVRQSFLDLLFWEAEKAGATVLCVSHDSALTPSFARVVAFSEINRANAPG
jgi:putative ABC transport system ATP-binding protein